MQISFTGKDNFLGVTRTTDNFGYTILSYDTNNEGTKDLDELSAVLNRHKEYETEDSFITFASEFEKTEAGKSNVFLFNEKFLPVTENNVDIFKMMAKSTEEIAQNEDKSISESVRATAQLINEHIDDAMKTLFTFDDTKIKNLLSRFK